MQSKKNITYKDFKRGQIVKCNGENHTYYIKVSNILPDEDGPRMNHGLGWIKSDTGGYYSPDILIPIGPQIKIAHSAGKNCWCEPVLDYEDPENGNQLWIHREIH